VVGRVSLPTTIEDRHRSPVQPRPVPELDPAPVPGPVGAVPDPLPGSRARPVLLVVGVLVVSSVAGRLVGPPADALLHNRMLPWILGRSLGIAAYLALTATVVLGLWLRHPWRAHLRRPSAESILWGHVALAACTVALLLGHLTALALDQYAGVGWTGVLVPGGATYRPTPVALGTLALYLLVLVVGTAALAGSIGRAVWFPVHAASVVVFCLTLGPSGSPSTPPPSSCSA
jgi:hypothetical protein